MASMGRWQCPQEIVAEARRRVGDDRALTEGEQVRLAQFTEAVLATPEGGTLHVLCLVDTEVVREIGRCLGVTVEVVS